MTNFLSAQSIEHLKLLLTLVSIAQGTCDGIWVKNSVISAKGVGQCYNYLDAWDRDMCFTIKGQSKPSYCPANHDGPTLCDGILQANPKSCSNNVNAWDVNYLFNASFGSDLSSYIGCRVYEGTTVDKLCAVTCGVPCNLLRYDVGFSHPCRVKATP